MNPHTSTSSVALQRNAEVARARFMLVVASYPVAATLLIFTFVWITMLSGERSVGNSTEFSSIDYPTSGITVSQSYIAKGRILSVPSGMTAYLITDADDLAWPKLRLGKAPIDWSHPLSTGSGSGFKYQLSVMLVDDVQAEIIEKWFDTGRQLSKYPPLRLSSDSRKVSTVAVYRN